MIFLFSGLLQIRNTQEHFNSQLL